MRISKDLLSGLMFLAIGAGAVLVARQYSLGTPSRMGPGFFPVVLASVIALLGAVIAVRAILQGGNTGAAVQWDFRPLLFISAAMVLFGFLIRDFGLVAAIVGLLLVGRLASREGSILELVAMVILLTLLPIGIFVYGLNIPLRVWPN